MQIGWIGIPVFCGHFVADSGMFLLRFFTFGKKKLGPGLTCGSVLKLMHRRALKSEVMLLGIHQITLSSMLFQLGILNLICLQGLGCETGMRFV
jgi:hypothetical protein